MASGAATTGKRDHSMSVSITPITDDSTVAGRSVQINVDASSLPLLYYDIHPLKIK